MTFGIHEMGLLRSPAMLLVVCAILALAPVKCPAQDAEQARIEALEAAFDQWLREVSFRCTYRLEWGTAAAAEIGSEGLVLTDVGETNVVTGLLAKLGDEALRLRLDYGHAPIKVSKNSTDDNSFDEVVRGKIGAESNWYNGQSGSVHFFPRSSNRNSSGALGSSSVGYQLPLNSLGSRKEANPLRNLDAHYDGPPAERSLEIVDAEHLRVVIKKPYRDGHMSSEVVFWTTPSTPVVNEFVTTYQAPHGTTRWQTVYSDFVKCPGGMVAATVEIAIQDSDDDSDSFKVWTSEGLGPAPEPEDFILRVSDEALLTCFEAASADKFVVRDETRLIDLTRISLGDLNCYGYGTETLPESSFRWSLLALAIGIVVTVGVLVYLYRRQARNRATPES